MIYINGRFLTQKLTGVQRFAYELTLKITKLKNNIVVLVPSISDIRNEYLVSSLKMKEVKGGQGHYWEQITLPRFLRKSKNSALINLCNSGPLFYKNQIVTQHDITYARYPNSFSVGFRFLYSVMAPALLRNSKAIITVSDFSKNEISDFYNYDKKKIHVISNAVNEKFHRDSSFSIESNIQYYLTVSSVNYHKNIHGLVNAILSGNININLKIIGDKTTVFNGIDISTSDPRISFLGRVTDDELIKLYQGAKAFIFPSLYEGFGIPPLEAQSCHCPVLSSNRASLQEILGDSALYFDPESEVEIVKAIVLVDGDINIRRALVDKGLVNTFRFSWDESAAKLNALIDSYLEY